MSLKRIAELTGTSVSTVSRVLNSSEHRCNQKGLAERIWKAAEELQYVPNVSARELRKGIVSKETPFAVDVLQTRFDSMDKDIFFLEVFHYVIEELMKNGCILDQVLNLNDIVSLEQEGSAGSIPYRPQGSVLLEKQLNTAVISRKKNTGLIVLGKCPAGLFGSLQKRYAYIVGIDRNPTEYEYDEVICNGAAAATMAVEYLIGLGHTSIAYIGDCNYESRYIGYYQALLNHKIPLRYNNVHQTSQTEEEGYRVMGEIIREEVKPSAVFCANDCTAIGVLKALKQNKKRGYQPSVISIDNILESQKTTPMLTTIDIPKKEMVHLAVLLLLDRRNGSHTESVRIELPCRLLERESCTYNSG